MQKTILRFGFLVAIMLSLLYYLHTSILGALLLSFEASTFLLAYIVNYIMVLSIYIILTFLSKKRPEIVGFAFMLGSGVKFLVFFLSFYRVFKEDGVMDRIEFGSFFIPYFSCLVVEVLFLLKTLKRA